MSDLPPERFRLGMYVIPLPSKSARDAELATENTSAGNFVDSAGPITAESIGVHGTGARRPPLHIRRLRRSHVHAAAKLAALMFVLRATPPIGWNETHCWLDCFSPRLGGICDPLFATAADLIVALPQLEMWLNDWAGSSDRAASTSPQWALERDISPPEVERVAQFIAQRLATHRRLTLEFCTEAGDLARLTIPPRADLQLPPGIMCQQRAECSTAKEDFEVYATATGEEVFVPADVAVHRPSVTPADRTRLRGFRMTSATRIDPVAPAEVTDDD